MKQKARLTIDMSTEEHKQLKMTCARLGVSMREFLLQAIYDKVEEMEDAYLVQEASSTLKEVKKGSEKIISWDHAKKLLDS